MLILFIIFLPRGIVGACADRWRVHNNSSVSAK
jgi:hypothetical protein